MPRPESERLILVAFGQAVRDLRKERGLSQEQLADGARLHRTYIGSLERGERNVSLFNINRLANALSVKASALMTETETHLRD